MPWQNAGEDFLPTLTAAGLEGTNVTDYMSYNTKNLYTLISEDARRNSAAWARSTANLNPNSMLEGMSVPLGDSGIYGIDDVVVDEGATPAKKTVRWEDQKTPDEKTPDEVMREAAATAAARCRAGLAPGGLKAWGKQRSSRFAGTTSAKWMSSTLDW